VIDLSIKIEELDIKEDTGINKMKPALVKNFSKNVPAWR
jgi:hypothetical protein